MAKFVQYGMISDTYPAHETRAEDYSRSFVLNQQDMLGLGQALAVLVCTLAKTYLPFSAQSACIGYLSGDLGTGKTTLTRAMLRALGVTGSIKSPTYALLEPYEIAALKYGKMDGAVQGILHHFDFYRLQNPQEWREAGFEEAFFAPHMAWVEWPEMAAGLPAPTLHIKLSHIEGDELQRSVQITVNVQCQSGAQALAWLAGLEG